MFLYDIEAYSVRRFVFFFQAEDGIRDYKVTGVQTCALPISGSGSPRPAAREEQAWVDLFVRLGWIALEPIDDAGLGRAQGYPVVGVTLHGHEELLDAALHLGVQIVLPVELGLEGILADEGGVIAPRPPKGEVVLGDHALAEVDRAEIEEHLLNDHLVHQLYRVGR